MQLFSVAFVRALLFPRLPESIFVFAGIELIRERNSRQNFLGESRYARLLGAKETKEYMPTFRSCCSMTKVPLQNNCYSMLRQIKGLKQLVMLCCKTEEVFYIAISKYSEEHSYLRVLAYCFDDPYCSSN